MAKDFNAGLAQVLTREIPDCQGLISAERLSGGASQETYRLVIDTPTGERLLCLRRAPGGVSVATGDDDDLREAIGLAVEARLIMAAHAAGVPEPEVYYVLTDADEIGNGFIMEWLSGEALGARIVRSPDLAGVRPQLARQCGEILARIHAIDLDKTGLRAVLPTETPEHLVQQTWRRYRRYETPVPMLDFAARWLLEHLPPTNHEQLVHNDFRNGNLMIDPTGVVGVLDWEIAHIGDPMQDLGWICVNSWRFGQAQLPVGGFGQLSDLVAGYETVAGTKVDLNRVKFWEVYGSFWWAVTTLGMAAHYRSGPDATVERPAIGRRCSEAQMDCVNLLMPGPIELVEPPSTKDDDLPRIDELLISVRDFLKQDVMSATQGRPNFLARVAANSLDVVLRDQQLGAEHRRLEQTRLRNLLGTSAAPLTDLRWDLVNRLRDEKIALDTPGLSEHLRQTVANQLAIDQPRYSALASAQTAQSAP